MDCASFFPLTSLQNGLVQSVTCSGLALDGLSSAYVPPDTVTMDAARLQLQCVVLFDGLFGTDTIVVQAAQSSLAGRLVFVQDARGLVERAQFLDCAAVVKLAFSGDAGFLIREILRLLADVYRGRIERAICDALSDLVNVDLTSVLQAANTVIGPYLAPPPLPPSPYYGATELNLTGSPLMGLVDVLLNNLVGLDGPFGLAAVVADLTNHTGAIERSWAPDEVMYTLAVPLVGNASFGLATFSLHGLDTLDTLQLLVPRDSVSLDSVAGLARLALNATFFVRVALDRYDTAILMERGQLRFAADRMDVSTSVAIGLDSPFLQRLSLAQLPSCGRSAVLGVNVTRALVGMDVREVVIQAVSTGVLEQQLDALLDNVLLLFVTSYRAAIPAFVNGFVLAPALRHLSTGPMSGLCALGSGSAASSGSYYALDSLALALVAGGCAAACVFLVFGIVVWHREWYSPALAKLASSGATRLTSPRRHGHCLTTSFVRQQPRRKR